MVEMHTQEVTDNGWPYLFPSPTLNIQDDPRLQTPGTFSRLVGIDARYKGKLRRFPGFEKTETINEQFGVDNLTWGGSGGATFFRYFAMQGGTGTSELRRGFVFLANDGSNDGLYARSARNGGVSYTTTKLLEFSAAVDKIDVDFDHRQFYVVAELSGGTKLDKVVFFKDSTGVFLDMDYSYEEDTTFAVSALGSATDFLKNGKTYSLAYRVVFPEQGIYTPLSNIVTHTMAADGFVQESDFSPSTHYAGDLIRQNTAQGGTSTTIQLDTGASAVDDFYNGMVVHLTGGTGSGLTDSIRKITDYDGTTKVATVFPSWTTDPDNTTTFDIWENDTGVGNATRAVVQIFRTVKEDFTTEAARGNLYLEHEVELAKVSGSSDVWRLFDLEFGADHSGLADEGLQLQPELNPDEVQVFSARNPLSNRVLVYEGVTLFNTLAEDLSDAKDTEILRWSFVHRDRPNVIPIDNRRAPEDLGDQMQTLRRVGAFAAAIYDNSVTRIHRSGSRLALDTIHNRHGSEGRWATVSVSGNLFMVSPVGVLVLDMNTGDLQVVNATQHICDDPANWRASLSDVRAAYDSRMGAVIFLNPTKKEVLLIWLNHGVVTMLEQMPFTDLTDGAEYPGGGARRAYFLLELPVASLDKLAVIYSIDDDRSADTRTTLGLASGSTHNGTVTTGTSTTVFVDSAATFSTDMEGHYVSFLSGALKGEAQRIKDVDTGTDTITVETAFSGTPATGDQYAIGAIPLRVTAWPLSSDPRNDGVYNMFHLKTVESMGLAVAEMSGETTSAFLTVDYQLYERALDTVAATVSGNIEAITAEGLNARTFGTFSGFTGPILIPGFELNQSNLDVDILSLITVGALQTSYADPRTGA